MAVTEVRLRDEQSEDTNDGRSHHQEWIVIYDTVQSSTSDALTATDGVRSIPQRGQAHSSADGTFCKGPVAKFAARPPCKAIIVTADFERPPSGFTTYDTNPLLRPPEIDYNPTELTEPYFFDESDPVKPAVNTAYEPFDEPPERDSTELELTYTRNYISHDPTAATKPVVNSDPVLIDGVVYAVGTLKDFPPKATKMIEKVNGVDVTYYRKTFTIRAREDGWDHDIESRGYNELSGGAWRRITDSQGKPVTKPYPLDAAVAKAASASTTPATVTLKPYARVAVGTYFT